MIPRLVRSLFAPLALLFILAHGASLAGGVAPDRAAVMRYAAASGEKTWRAAQNPDRYKPLSRELFTYALALCEAGEHPERLDGLFSLAARMQDRDPKSRGYGNLLWAWGQTRVLDYNAVEFCMQAGALIWLRHQGALSEPVRAKLHDLLRYAVQGCLRHKVKENYTNIALMNAANLILLGEALDDKAAADEGYARLERDLLEIWNNGIHEYDSPTYYGTDLDDLVLLEAFCQRETGRRQARALLELFWTDIALNWLPSAQKLAGARSRDYDYLRGLGKLDIHMWFNGWLDGEMQGGIEAVYPALGRWSPPARLRELNAQRFPRLVRQVWGESPCAIRTHYLMRDVSLSAAGEYYGGWMDLPLCVDFAGPRESVRGYFIPDGRHDPYGKVKIADKSGAHAKTFHLGPFFAGAQCKRDALGLALYRDGDVTSITRTLESHFVLPFAADELWVGERRVTLAAGQPTTITLGVGEAVALRKGSAAVVVRAPWTRGCDGREARVAFVWDGNPYGAVRLTVDHRLPACDGNAPRKLGLPGALFWVRIGDGVAAEADFARWRRAFAAGEAQVEASAERIAARVSGADGLVALDAAAPFKQCGSMAPAPDRVLLELDGQDIGREILREVAAPIVKANSARKAVGRRK